MLIHPYSLAELKFAWTYHVYICTRTYRRQLQAELAKLCCEQLNQMLAPYSIQVLEFVSTEQEFRMLLSLVPGESVKAAVSKLKGRISQWLNSHKLSAGKSKVLARGYFAATSGKSTTELVANYLEKQGSHHGYDRRPRPPVYVQTYTATERSQSVLETNHARTRLKFHIVLSTEKRRGVFGADSGRAIADCWKSLENEQKIFVSKVSFVPDHVHLAVEVHSTVSPAELVVVLMNSAQELMWQQFSNDVIFSRVHRLWQSSAYIGSFGDLTSNALVAFLKNWENVAGEE